MVETATIPVLVLAGGEGSRLWPITDVWPKALVPVAGKPCARWIIEELQRQGFGNITVCINAGDEQAFYYAFDYGLQFPLKYSAAPKTATICERILLNRDIIAQDDLFLVIYGDDLTHTDYVKLVDSMMKDKHIDVVLATTSSVELEFGIIESYKGRVSAFIEKPTIRNLTGHAVWTGRVAMRSSLLPALVGRSDLAKDVFPYLLLQPKQIYVQNGNEPWYDVGNIKHLRRVNEAYEQKPSLESCL